MMRVLILLLSAQAISSYATAKSNGKTSPIAKVIELLDELKAKMIAEGEVEGEQFEKYTQWCAEEADVKEDAIKFGSDRVASLNAELEQLNGEVATLGSEIEQVVGEIGVNDRDLQEATGIREKDKADFGAADKELSDTVDMIIRAKVVLKKQLNLGLAQTGKGGRKGVALAPSKDLEAYLRKVIAGLSAILDAAFVDAKSHKALSAFISASMDDEDEEDDMQLQPAGAPKPEAYKSHSSGILDVLDDLQEKAEEEQAELRKKEMNQNHAFQLLKQQLDNEISIQTDHLNELKGSSSSKREAIGIASGDLATATKTLKEDKTYYEKLMLGCQEKSNEWELRQKSRAEELQAIEKAKEILSGEGIQGAVDRRYSAAGAMVQVAKRGFNNVDQTNNDNLQRASRFLEVEGRKLGSVGLSQLATRFRVGADPFEKVKGMIQAMIERLIKEEAEEADHKAWCDEETAKSKKSREKHQDRVDVLSGRIDKATAGVDKLGMDITALTKEVAEMNAAEAESTQIRNNEREEYQKAIKDYAEAIDALSQAITVLTDYYGSSGEQAALLQAGQDPKFGGPVFKGEYQKQDGSGIIAMLEVAQSDFSKMDSETKAAESEAEKENKDLMQDNAVSRATKEADIKGKTAEKGRLENNLSEMQGDRKASQKELDAVLEYLDKLKGACEVVPMSYEERVGRRRAEIDSLREAMAILSGEDISTVIDLPEDQAGGAAAFMQVRNHAPAQKKK